MTPGVEPSSATVDEYRGDTACSLARAVGVVGEKWTFFILREALVGTTRFAQFRSNLGIAPDVLSARLATLTAARLMETVEYREEGQRARSEYRLTQAGEEFALVIAALQQWGDKWTPSRVPTSVGFEDNRGRPLETAFVDAESQHGARPLGAVRRLDQAH